MAVDPPPPPVSVSVLPGSAQPFAGAAVQFSAVVQNAANPAVNWQVNTIPGGNTTVGTIDSSGMYKAPRTVPSQPTVTVSAILQMDPTKTASSSVTIQPDISLSISPALASFTPSQSWQFEVSTPGFSNGDVAWAVDGVPSANTNATTGTITATGMYTAPASPGFHAITAKLATNPSTGGSAAVYVTNFPGTLTWRNDNARSGVNNREMALAPATVNSSTFGKLFSCPLDGYAYAQPLYVPRLAMGDGSFHNVVFVATEKDSVYAFDADQSPCKQLWQASLIPAGSEAIPAPNLDITSTDLGPFIGITGTPAIDLDLSNLYVVAKTRSKADTKKYSQQLYALDLATGQPKILPTGAVISFPELPSVPFSPLKNQRPALLLDNGILYVGFGSHGGQGDYRGWLPAYSASTLAQTSAFSDVPDLTQGGIWQSGGGPSADPNNNVYVLTGDGPFNANRPGGTSYGNSALRLNTSGGLTVADYFSPCDNPTLGTMDFEASAPLLVDPAGPASEPHLLVGASKSGSLYIMNRESLGGFNSACTADSLPRVQAMPVGDSMILSTPLFWNNTIFVAAGNGKLKAFPLQGGVLASSPVSQSLESFGPQGATPVISFNGAVNGTSGAILWLIDSSGGLATAPLPNTAAILRAFDPNNLSNEIYNSVQVASRDTAGLAVKFTVPTVANGKVYVGTQTELDVYGLLH
ncbi:MAG: hypothetical protein LAO08_03660 [Acidobacteriia bacterium]|nr:hypothetical protein [Terriglobia bacterium]